MRCGRHYTLWLHVRSTLSERSSIISARPKLGQSKSIPCTILKQLIRWCGRPSPVPQKDNILSIPIRTMLYRPLSCVPKGGYRNLPLVQDSAQKTQKNRINQTKIKGCGSRPIVSKRQLARSLVPSFPPTRPVDFKDTINTYP